MTDIVSIDLFCGAGGLTRGLLDAGVKVKFGLDLEEGFRRTYEANNKPAIYYRADIRTLSGIDLSRRLNVMPHEFFLLAACAQCQPFSKHIKNHHYDRRKSLLLEVGRLLKEFDRKPDGILLENVPAIRKINNGRILKSFHKVLDRLGYKYKHAVLDAKDYGVPQTRRRFVLMAIRKGVVNEISFPEKTHGKGLLKYKTVGETIKHLPPIAAGKKHKSIVNHESANLSELNKKRLALVKRNGGSRTEWPDEYVLNCHKEFKGHTDVYGRMKWNAPSPTLTCKCVSLSNGRYGHPTQLRAISLKEAALLQTFPDKYHFYGNFRSIATQIGNAVPVQFAKVFGNHIQSLVSTTS